MYILKALLNLFNFYEFVLNLKTQNYPPLKLKGSWV